MSQDLREQLQATLGDAYLLERELGGGGMSRVFLAQRQRSAAKVVVKVLLPELAAGVSVERFRREIQLAAQLQHPHIVPLLAAGEFDGLPYFTMPFIDGESLRARVRPRRAPRGRDGAHPAGRGAALAYAHALGVVHRDIKPDNVLLSGGVAVVTDFGVAKAVSVKGEVAGRPDVLVRVHSECLTGDVFHSRRCDCGEQLEAAMKMIEERGEGVLLYLAQEGRGIGLLNKLQAYKLQEEGLDTVEANLELGLPADLRDYGIGAQILADLGLNSIRLLTNNPKKIHGLEGHGLRVSAQVPIARLPNPHNTAYLQTKVERMGHLMQLAGPAAA